MAGIVELSKVSISFGAEVIYDELTFSVQDGEFLCILGPSGCGKSTLLRVIGDLLKVDSGSVTVDGRPAHDAWQEIAYVFQSPRLLPWRNAEQNVILASQLRFGRKADKERTAAEARDLLQLVGLGNDTHKMPAMLSGGERQRVAIARALAVNPRIVLMDEPFSALDLKTRRRMRAEIVDIWKKTGKTIVFVTHEIEKAIELADRIIVLSPKPTVVREVVSIATERPRNLQAPELEPIRRRLHQLIGVEDDTEE